MLFFNDEQHSPVEVSNVYRFNKVAKAMVPCWLYKPLNKDEDRLLGPRHLYMMKAVDSRELKVDVAAQEANKWWPF